MADAVRALPVRAGGLAALCVLVAAPAALAQGLLPPGNVPNGSAAPPAFAAPAYAAPATSGSATSGPAFAPQAAPSAQSAPAAQASRQPLALPAQAPLPTPAPLLKETGTAAASPAAPAPATTGSIARPAAAAEPPAEPVRVAAAGTGPGGQRAAAATIERINTYFNSFKTMMGRFVQVDPDGQRRTGEFYILKPGRVLFEYAPPSQVVLVADGRSVSVRDKRLKTQDITPLAATPLRFLLSDNMDLARNGNVVGVYQDDMFATVVLEERQPAVGTYRLMIMFDAKTMQLKQWTVTDPQGYDTTVAVSNLNMTDRPDPMMFVINRN